jgi:hypothetical protein
MDLREVATKDKDWIELAEVRALTNTMNLRDTYSYKSGIFWPAEELPTLQEQTVPTRWQVDQFSH